MLGTITRKLDDKDYGFIQADGDFYFFHKNTVSPDSPLNYGELKVGQQVSFEPSSKLVSGEKKLRAESVCFII